MDHEDDRIATSPSPQIAYKNYFETKECRQVREVLEDVLPRKKLVLVDDNKIESVISRIRAETLNQALPEPGTAWQADGIDYKCKYFPVVAVDKAVTIIVEELKTPAAVGGDEEEDGNNSSEDGEQMEVQTFADLCRHDMIRSLSHIYPDIDLVYLKQIIDRFYGNAEEIQKFLETNIENIPDKKTIQAVQFRLLSFQADPRKERPWQCPSCRSWRMIQIPASVRVQKNTRVNNMMVDTDKIDPNKAWDEECQELVSCGRFCVHCGKKSHGPFRCRQSGAGRLLQAEHEVDLFRPLPGPPDLELPAYRVFVMKPRVESNFADPRDVLYLAAEGTFLKMVKKSALHMSQAVNANPSQPQIGNANLLQPQIGNANPLQPANGNANPLQPQIGIPNPLQLQIGNQNPLQPQIGNANPLQPQIGNLNPPQPQIGNANPPQPLIGNANPLQPQIGNPNSLQPNANPLQLSAPPQAASAAPAVQLAVSANHPSRINRLHSIRSSILSRRAGFHGLEDRINDRSFVQEIKYYENDRLLEQFQACKAKFAAQGIPTKERLVFHGTSVDKVSSIMEEGFLLSKCKRFAMGYGIYFSEFPDISKVYGKALLLCRVLVGAPYQVD